MVVSGHLSCSNRAGKRTGQALEFRNCLTPVPFALPGASQESVSPAEFLPNLDFCRGETAEEGQGEDLRSNCSALGTPSISFLTSVSFCRLSVPFQVIVNTALLTQALLHLPSLKHSGLLSYSLRGL